MMEHETAGGKPEIYKVTMMQVMLQMHHEFAIGKPEIWMNTTMTQVILQGEKNIESEKNKV